MQWHQVFAQCCHAKRRGEGDLAEVSNFSLVCMGKGRGDSAETLTFVATGKGKGCGSVISLQGGWKEGGGFG